MSRCSSVPDFPHPYIYVTITRCACFFLRYITFLVSGWSIHMLYYSLHALRCTVKRNSGRKVTSKAYYIHNRILLLQIISTWSRSGEGFYWSKHYFSHYLHWIADTANLCWQTPTIPCYICRKWLWYWNVQSQAARRNGYSSRSANYGSL